MRRSGKIQVHLYYNNNLFCIQQTRQTGHGEQNTRERNYKANYN